MKPENEPTKTGHDRPKEEAQAAPDAPTRDVHHDESRRNSFDPEVAEDLKGGSSGSSDSQ